MVEPSTGNNDILEILLLLIGINDTFLYASW